MSKISRRALVLLAVLLAGTAILWTRPVHAGGPHPSTGDIQGTVSDVHGHPAAGVHVRLEDGQHHVVGTTTTDPHGEFHFLHVAPGHYTVRAVGRHRTHGSAAVDVHAGHTVTVHIVLH